MATTYSMKVTQMDCLPQAEGQTDVVVCVHWAYTGVNGDKSAGFGGTTNLTYSGGSFTPFDQLTEEQVVGWVLAAWSPEEKQRIEGAIEAQMEVVSPSIPWVQPEPMPPPVDPASMELPRLDPAPQE